MNVAIVGCGLIGGKRARALGPGDRLIAVCDLLPERARALAEAHGSEAAADWRAVVNRPDVDAMVVSTVNDSLASVTIAGLRAGKHVLCEKPLGRNAEEAERMVRAAREAGRVLKTGFNHRFHPAVFRAKKMVDDGEVGDLLSIRARYGHGGRPGMEKEWRSSREICGGGELLDQGVHVIDLIRWFGGEVTEAFGKVETKFWEIGVEDNAFGILKSERNVTAQFHVSWTNWKNIFSLEIFGRDGYLHVSGLGGSYGPESLEWGKRNPAGGRPAVDTVEFPADDRSWNEEWKEFLSAIRNGSEPAGSGFDGLQANRIVAALYESSDIGRVVRLKVTPSGQDG